MKPAPLTSGERNKRIMLRRVDVSRDPQSGAEQRTTVDVATPWAKVEPISNRKIRTIDQQQVVETILFTLAPRSDVDIDWQVVFAGRVYTVRATDRTQSDRLLITAEADARHDRV
ncbi:phage head closure protein [Martelella alba]|uniref:Head-tail adaptor protein n=1 Tax=Martelella alba TaxID=2590451 RepID=A0ABY2SFQ1_9HYPH|nr:phage head closure protein [Martelella alba]TKI02669.1 head-tail adaptor protein [Martelella alba]